MICQTNTLTECDEFLFEYLAGYYEAYGAAHSFLRFYRSDSGGQLCILDGVVTVCGNGFDIEELRLFLQMQPDIVSVCCSREIADCIRSFDKWSLTAYPVMRYERPQAKTAHVESSSPRPVYALLSECFGVLPPFESWYLDVCHRLRRDLCHIAAVCENDIPISSAMTVAEHQNGAVIGAVATHPAHRRKGYAGRCVTALAESMRLRNKTVYICPKTDSAQRLYESLGFILCGETVILERKS